MKYILYENWGGRFHDAKKSPAAGDDLMCWAAAASNVLAWTRWGVPNGHSFKTEQDIFQYFQDHWLDQVGYPQRAWEWWFNGADQPGVELPGGGFWKSHDFSSNYHVKSDRRDALPDIEGFLKKGYGVVLHLISQAGGHYVTCWGFESDGNGNHVGIFVTDSDDTINNLRYYHLSRQGWSYEGWWYFTYFKNSLQYLVSEVHSLDRCPTIPSPPSAPSKVRIVS